MTTTNLQVRRATVEDLPRLGPLWQQEHLSVSDLEKRFKEFQVVEAVGGEMLGAIGLQVAGPDGRLHSEVFAHADQSNALREKLWERAQVLAFSRSGGEEAGWFHRRCAAMALFATEGRIRARGLTGQGVCLVQGIGEGDDQPIVPPGQGHESDRGGGCVRGLFHGRRLGVLLFQTPETAAWTVRQGRGGVWQAGRSRLVSEMGGL